MIEIWKPVQGYEGLYEVSSFARVRSISRGRNTGKILQPAANPYPRLSLSKDGLRKNQKVHRLVALAFIPNPDNKPQVNHKNGIKTDNRLENLEWVTNAENGQHSHKVLGNPLGGFAAVNKNKTHCKWGHEFTKENTTLLADGEWRDCRTCRNLAQRERTKRNRLLRLQQLTKEPK